MLIKTRAVLLQASKHHDNALLLKLFTRDKGLITCFVKNTRTKTRRTVKWQVLDVVDLDLVHTEKSDLYGIKESTYAVFSADRYFDPYKLSVCYFTAEILLKAIGEKSAEHYELFDFAIGRIEKINAAENIALLPFEFLVALTDILGIRPQVYPGGFVFNLSEGSIEKVPRGLQSISIPEVETLGYYLQNNCFAVPPTKAQRARMLQLMLDFYKYHVPGFIEIKSLGVLREVLN